MLVVIYSPELQRADGFTGNKIQGIGSPIAITRSAETSLEPFNETLVSWQMLLKLAQVKNIGAANTKYLKTHFSVSEMDLENKKRKHYEVYVVLKQATQKIAIKFDLLWHENKWLLINVDHDFYSYGIKTFSKSAFRAKGWAESLKPAAYGISKAE